MMCRIKVVTREVNRWVFWKYKMFAKNFISIDYLNKQITTHRKNIGWKTKLIDETKMLF